MIVGSPYQDRPYAEWRDITQSLIASHPLSVQEIMQVVHVAWHGVWSTQIGTDSAKLSLYEVNPPATVIGYFFEKLMGKELAARYPHDWAGGSGGSEKDLHYISDKQYSIEVKTSGQLGLKIYGNRSYGQEIANLERAKKDKSGFYITVNFYGSTINFVRFGWIDASDWQAQKSSTGQMAALSDQVYGTKLIPIGGDYTLNAPIQILPGVGSGTAKECNDIGLYSIRDVLSNPQKIHGKLDKVYRAAEDYNKLWGG